MGRKEQSPLRMLVLISQLGITMMVAMAISGILGLGLASLTKSDLCFPFFLLLGAMAGFRSCYKVILKFVSIKNSDAPRRSALEGRKQEKKDHG